MARISKLTYIDFIKNYLASGGTSLKECFKLHKTELKRPLGETQFKVYWKQSQELYLKYQVSKNKQFEHESLKMALKTQEKILLTRLDRLEIASKIALGKPFEQGKELIYPTMDNRLKAIDYLSKVEATMHHNG